MIEIKFEAKGETLKELLQHMNMVKMLIELRKNDEIVEDCNNNGKTETSSYEYSLKSVKPPEWIIGVAIKGVTHRGIKGTSATVNKGDHATLLKTIISEGKTLDKDRVEGFLLKNGKFLNREEAYLQALKNNQIQKEERYSLNSGKPKLYSQDLW